MTRTTKLVSAIIIVSLLLLCCIAVDYADEPIVVTENQTTYNNTTNATVLNDSFHSEKATGVAKLQGVVVKKHKLPLIRITAKPSCGCRHSYRWHTTTFVNYCPHCHRYNALYNKHKWNARYEQELTCRYDDCDYCGICGKEKYSWSHYYLRRA